jgi:hypothetical protein
MSGYQRLLSTAKAHALESPTQPLLVSEPVPDVSPRSLAMHSCLQGLPANGLPLSAAKDLALPLGLFGATLLGEASSSYAFLLDSTSQTRVHHTQLA